MSIEIFLAKSDLLRRETSVELLVGALDKCVRDLRRIHVQLKRLRAFDAPNGATDQISVRRLDKATDEVEVVSRMVFANNEQRKPKKTTMRTGPR